MAEDEAHLANPSLDRPYSGKLYLPPGHLCVIVDETFYLKTNKAEPGNTSINVFHPQTTIITAERRNELVELRAKPLREHISRTFVTLRRSRPFFYVGEDYKFKFRKPGGGHPLFEISSTHPFHTRVYSSDLALDALLTTTAPST